MPTCCHIDRFGGLPVVEFPAYDTVDHDYQRMVRAGTAIPDPYPPHAALAAAVEDPGSVAWRLRRPEPSDYRGGRFVMHDPLEDRAGYLARFGEEVDLAAVRALVVGYLAERHRFEGAKVLPELMELVPRLPNLRSLFFAEVVREESEISWIHNTDVAPLLDALPSLTEFTVRGSSGLGLDIGRHDRLRRLTVQCGGLPGRVARDIAAADLPTLEHLELWLGDEEYGNDTVPADLAAVLSGEAFPALRSLGLRNAEDTDAWVRAVSDAPVVERLHTLDLSLGCLTDEGAETLLASPALRGLGRLDLHHHYLSEDMAERVRAEFTAAGVEVDVSVPQEPDEDEDEDGAVVLYRYSAVSE